MKVFLVDVAVCNGCYCCQIACKDEHAGNDFTPYSKPQPDTGQFWLKVNEYTCGTVPKVKMHYVPTLCNHCDEMACADVCPDEAIYKRTDGIVIIDPVKCSGCRLCLEACPYGAIYFNEELNIAQKCTGCAHLLDAGWEEPRCVDVCPTQALRFVDEAEVHDELDGAEVMRPESGCQPRVYYKNIPRKFVAGTVYDPVKKEIVKGAVCTLTDEQSKKMTVKTDGFGDFWFKDLDVGAYSLEIAADGFPVKVIEGIDTQSDVNLGDIPLS